MNPLFVGGLGSSALLLGGLVFAIVLVVVVVGVLYAINPWGSEPWEEFAEAAQNIVDDEDADAIALIPYSDGPMVPKAAIYDKELLGGKGGYRTADGDRIYVDGQGNGKFTMMGVDIITAIDPTEHAAAADPLKAFIAHKNNVGEWIKVDRKANLIEAGEALESLDGVTPAMETPLSGQAATDGGYPSEVHEVAAEQDMSLDDAKKQLEEQGLLHKIVDLAPPSEAVIDDETGQVNVEDASHCAVDFSSAADLLPKKTNTTAWQTMEEKARQEGRDEDKIRENLMFGFFAGAAAVGIVAVILVVIMGFF